jgi:hypothetical protein
MVRVLMTLAALLPAAAPGLAQAQGGQGATWSVVTLRVDKPLPDHFKETFNPTGVFVSLVLHVPDKYVVGLNYQECKLESASDDKGTNLLENPKKPAFPITPFGPDFRAGPGGAYFLTTLMLPNWPAAGATKLRFKGSARVLCGAKEKTVEVKDVSLKAGMKTIVGPASVSLDQFQLPQEISVQVRSPLPTKKIEFLDASGKTLTHFGNMSPVTLAKGLEYTGLYHIRAKLDSVTVRLTYFEEQEQLTIPLDVAAGLGL